MNQPVKALSLFDAVSLIVGIIIGAGIYETTPTVAAAAGGWPGVIGVWIAGGLLVLCGALCYAELAAAYPHQGGDYVYLTRAFGARTGFMFGWSQLVIIRPGDIALMAFVFARYAAVLYAPFPGARIGYAALAVAVLTAINIFGVREGKWTQNILTLIKTAGLLFIVAAGFFAPQAPVEMPSVDVPSGGIGLAMILVLYTYGGWNEMAYVAAEIKQPRQNIPRALLLGTMLVIVLYLLINGAFLRALGYEGMASSESVAVDAVARVMPAAATRMIAVIICISALGAVNGLVFSGARISYALGSGHRVFKTLGRWHPQFGTPVAALVMQAGISLVIILLAGSFIDTILYTAPVVWFFFLATGLSLFRLRRLDRFTARSFAVPGYPVVPWLFCATALFMACSATGYAWSHKPAGLLILSITLLTGYSIYMRRQKH